MRLIFIVLYCFANLPGPAAQSLKTPFEKNNNQTSTYIDCINFYKALEKKSGLVKVFEAGPSDVSLPIYTVVLSSKKNFTPEKSRKAGKAILFINNGIHPGEPDGIEASMMFARDLVSDPNQAKILDEISIVIIPIYNVGGSLLRNKYSRVNQNGPDEYGFRGNAQNLDLNRDFIKCDSRNAKTFTQLFRHWDPDIFLETHTTDGADYPYLMTLLSSQRHKLQIELANYIYKHFIPPFIKSMSERNLDVIPYVNSEGDPSGGIFDFLDSPRFSTGYAALFHCMGFLAESHMLKPYNARVSAHKLLMQKLAEQTRLQKNELLRVREEAKSAATKSKTMDIRWKIDKSRCDSLYFTGYTAEKKISELTGLERISYDKNKPYSKNIPYYNVCQPVKTVKRPTAYFVPAAFEMVIERLKWNGVQMHRLEKDSLVRAHYYKIKNFKSVSKPYEGHFMHQEVETESIRDSRMYFKGDYIIYTQQPAIRYIVETLEPEAHDAFFVWNFFDPILQRKEYFSDYLFEDLAVSILENDRDIKKEFEERKLNDSQFARSSRAMLEFIYDRSKYAEPGYRLYPVALIYQED
ncbi:MAG: M14 family metallopeptidase [Saprospiraceae bacterium]|nr:M14 family metallopeptidase [Saprospiraceae bacterium]